MKNDLIIYKNDQIKYFEGKKATNNVFLTLYIVKKII